MYSVIELEGKRVLTTTQVADAYEVDAKSLQRNFQRNKARFEQGLHFFILTGDALKAFKAERQNDAQSNFKYATQVYLWTEEGAFLLAKSVSSEKGWAAYRLLVTNYYKVAVALRQPEAPLALPFDEARYLALESRVQEIEQRILEVTLHSGEQLRLKRAVGERVYSMSVKQAERNKLFRAIYHELKERYHVGSYRDIKQHELQDALSFVFSWTNSVHA